ncbi:unnamed protein product, partial [Rotaria magnacalcarata]
MSKHHHH